MKYSNDLSVAQARDLYFKHSGFNEATYTDKWVTLPVLGFNISLPNIKLRREAVPFHDIDHVLTEYSTDWPGEWQISSYELGTGCGYYFIGWVINLQAILAGAIRTPKACIKAFARGRRSKGVYKFNQYKPLLLENLGELRSRTTAKEDGAAPTISDILLFYTMFFLSIIIHMSPLFLAMLFFKA